MNRTSGPKVLHLASGDLWAGAESQLLTLVTTLHNSLDVALFVVLLNHGTLEERLRSAGVEVIVLDESIHNNLQILGKLIRILRNYRPDVIHTHRSKENILGSLAALLSGGIPSLRTAHGAPEHSSSRQRIIRYIDRLTMRLIQDRMIAVSDDLADKLRNEFTCKKIRVIENGIDSKLFSKLAYRHTSPPTYNGKYFRVGLAGRLVPVKRVDLFIKTARYILDMHPDIKIVFHVFGDGPLRNELETLSRNLHTDNIICFEGHSDDIARKLQHLDILLMTSDHEGLPMILMEAMALDVPVIAHSVGGIPKLLDHGACGVLVSNHSAAGYADKILYLYHSPQLRTELAARALDRVTTVYSAIHNARAYLAQYNEIRKST